MRQWIRSILVQIMVGGDELMEVSFNALTVQNKANLRDLITATGLVILLKFDPNHRFFSPCDLEIWWMTLENNRAPLLYYTKLCASFQIHRWIETEVTVRKSSIWVKIGNFLSCVTLKFDGWPCKTMPLQALCIISYPLVNSNLSYSLETPNLGQIQRFLMPCDLEIWRMTLQNNRAPLLCYFKLCAAFHTHWWIQTGVTVRKRLIWVKFDDF